MKKAIGCRPKMTPFGSLVIEVLEGNIRVSLEGSNYAVTYHKPRNSPQLLAKTLSLNEDRNAPMTQGEFLALAWKAANDKAREMGWIR
jgi:hypothetical protein